MAATADGAASCPVRFVILSGSDDVRDRWGGVRALWACGAEELDVDEEATDVGVLVTRPRFAWHRCLTPVDVVPEHV